MKRFGLIGEVLSYSYSPIIHKAFYTRHQMDAVYELREVKKKDFSTTIRSILEEYRGLNITIPYKNDILPFLDTADEASRQIGAVNTVSNVDGTLIGFNTDVYGFLDTLDHYRVPVQGARYVILGTGGAAKSVYYGLKTRQVASISFVSRRRESDWIKDEKIWTYDDFPTKKADVFVNTTPVGMTSKEARSPIEVEKLDGAGHVVDLIYNPEKTPLLVEAEKAGLQVVNGLFMLVSQALKSEEIWTGVEVDAEEKERIHQIIAELMYK